MRTNPAALPPILLIGGTSHTGKTSLARALAERLGRAHCRTDKLARHPGRPWSAPGRTVPPPVAEHYLGLEPDALLTDVLRHYRENAWPQVRQIVADADEAPLVLEGSAVLPGPAAQLLPGRAAAVWLTADADVLRSRIHTSSARNTRQDRERLMIDRFLARTLLFDQHVRTEAERLGLATLDVTGADSPADLADRCIELLSDPRFPHPNSR
jgi:shikimate kinase